MKKERGKLAIFFWKRGITHQEIADKLSAVLTKPVSRQFITFVVSGQRKSKRVVTEMKKLYSIPKGILNEYGYEEDYAATTGTQSDERKTRILTALKKCAENPSPIGDCRKCEAYLREYEACAYAYGRELGLPMMSELR